MDLVLFGRAHRGKAIDFIEEDYTGLAVTRFFEQEAQLALCFADPFRKDVSSFTHEEGYERVSARAVVRDCTYRCLCH